MRLNKLLCLATIVLSMNVSAQDLKIIVNKQGNIGYADKNGNEVIKCQYENVQPFTDGVAIVTKSGKTGIIDTTGKVILPLEYTQIILWNKDLYLIKKGEKAGLADHKGKVILPANYSHISKPNCYGKAIIALGGKPTKNDKKTYMANAKYGIIDAMGNILVNPQYKGLYEFSFDGTNKYPYYEGKRLEYSYHNTIDTLVTDCSYLGFNGNGFSIYNAGIMDGNGNELLKAGLYNFVMQPKSGIVRYYNFNKKQTLCGYHDISTGKGFQAAKFDLNISNINYWTHGDFIGDIAPVNGSSWSFIDKNGTTLRSGFSSLKHSQTTGLWAAKNSFGKWDVFDDTNNNVEALSIFDDINFPAKEGDKEVFSVMKEGKYGCIKRTGEVVVPFEYEQAFSNIYDVIAVKKNGKWGLLSADNTLMIPTEYAGIIFPSERDAKHFWVMKSDSLYYHFNKQTNRLSKTGYKIVYNFDNKLAYVTPPEMKIKDTQINRAQIYALTTSKANADTLDINTYANKFVYIINTDDKLVFDLPISIIYMDTIKKAIEKHGGKQFTEAEQKNLLLDVTRDNRSYNLHSIISEEEWNY